MFSNPYVCAVVSTVIVCLISLLGVLFVALRKSVFEHLIFVLLSFAVGSLLGNVFFHLLPESYSSILDKSLIGWLIAMGFFVFFLIDTLQHFKHHKSTKIKSYGYLILYADGIHNFTDGVLIGAGWLVSPEIGLTTTLAIVAHEIPHEISNFAVLIHAGLTKGKALLYNLFSASTAILGTVLTLIFSSDRLNPSVNYILPFAAGGFIYLSASALVPELAKTDRKNKAAIQILFIAIGLVMMYFFSVYMAE